MSRTKPLGFLLAALAFPGCRDAADSPAAEVPEAPRVGPSVAPIIESFLAEHPDFGTLLGREGLPDWADGARSRATTESGEYVFYLKDGEVHAVYSYAERGGRLWLTGPRFRREPLGGGDDAG